MIYNKDHSIQKVFTFAIGVVVFVSIIGLTLIVNQSFIFDIQKKANIERDQIFTSIGRLVEEPLKRGDLEKARMLLSRIEGVGGITKAHIEYLTELSDKKKDDVSDSIVSKVLYLDHQKQKPIGLMQLTFDNLKTEEEIENIYKVLGLSIFLLLILIGLSTVILKTIFFESISSAMNQLRTQDLSGELNLETTKIKEINELFRFYLGVLKDMKELTAINEQKTAQIRIGDALTNLSKQVSHDIRSPLTALNMMLGQMTQLPEQQRVMMRGAISRINDIANELLTKGRQIQQGKASQGTSVAGREGDKLQLTTQLIAPLVDSLVSEKRIQFREKQNIEIVADIDKGYGLFAKVNANELNRTVSNLLNNAIEAIPEAGGRIIVAIRGYSDLVSIVVQDNGKGIPHHIVEKLGQQGLSHGKEGTQSGSGLGVYHAKKTVESFGGKFDIASREGVGTTISMHFPRVTAPKWFVETLSLMPHQQVVSVDDDLSIHGIWKGRFESERLDEIGLEHLTFTSGAEFKGWFNSSSNESGNRLYLVDFELLNQKDTGLEIIEQLKIGSQSILVTSRYEEAQIREKCEQLGVRLIPKTMAGFVPIDVEEPRAMYDVALLDDDPLVEMTWKMAAEAKGKTMIYFANSEDFFKEATKLDFEVPVYVDSNLGSGIRGEEVAKKMFEMGFKNIWLCTGYQASEFPPMSWIKGVVPKDPVF